MFTLSTKINKKQTNTKKKFHYTYSNIVDKLPKYKLIEEFKAIPSQKYTEIISYLKLNPQLN